MKAAYGYQDESVERRPDLVLFIRLGWGPRTKGEITSGGEELSLAGTKPLIYNSPSIPYGREAGHGWWQEIA